jgi:hypothetical protein
MNAWLLGAVTVLYLVAAVDNLMRGAYPLALVLTSYAAANLGLLLMARTA